MVVSELAVTVPSLFSSELGAPRKVEKHKVPP